MITAQLVQPPAELSVVPPEDAFGLEFIEDHSWLTADDNEAYYGLLNYAQQVPELELIQAGKEFLQQRQAETKLPSFVDMIRNPKAFRGKPVFLKGHVLQTQTYEALDNEYGIETLTESALFIDDAFAHPITVVFIHRPDALKVGGELIDGVEVAGYFLKTYRYPSVDKETRVAPMILANTVNVRTLPPAAPLVPPAFAYGGVIVFFVMFVGFVWYVSRSDRRRQQQRREQSLEERPNFSGVEEAPLFPHLDGDSSTP